MTLYVETSALIAWLLGEPDGSHAADVMRAASEVVTSDLTFVECGRALHQATFARRLQRQAVLRALERLDEAAAPWIRHALTPTILQRAAERFPREPIRALDALHLATALVVREIRPDLVILSFDNRVVENARALDFRTITRPRLVPRNGP